MWVRSDVTSGCNRRWEWRPDAGDAEDGKMTSDASGRGARASDAGLIFADGLDHSIFMILLVCRHLDCIFHYSLSGRRDRRLTTGGVGTPSAEIAVGRFSESSWARFRVKHCSHFVLTN